MFFLLFLLYEVRIRIWIRTSDKRIRIREAQKRIRLTVFLQPFFFTVLGEIQPIFAVFA
jgi:hypothetical protein